MALGNIVEGAKKPSQLITWTDLDLTAATITAEIKFGDAAAVASSGAFTVTDAAAGVFRWDYSTADTATAGYHTVQFTATFVGDPTPAISRAEAFTVTENITT